MSFSRYKNDSVLRGGKIIGTSEGLIRFRRRLRRGEIPTTAIVLKEGQRLDQLAQKFYGDGRLWWVIAAASGIGWWLQAPPGTRVLIPTDIQQVEEIF